MPSQPPAERFASILLCLSHAVAARGCGGWGMASSLIGLIITRIRDIKQRFARFADRVGAGKPVGRRRTARPRASARGRPRPPGQLPRAAGWLWALMPEAVGFRSQLEYLLNDPEMVALLAAAPVSTLRAVRSLCWALRLPPPPILALPKPPAPPLAPPPPAAPPPAPAAPPPASRQQRWRRPPLFVPAAAAPRPKPARAPAPPNSG